MSAKNYCETIGGSLVSINSLEEQNFLHNFAKSQDERKYYWIGGRSSTDGNWNWSDGSQFGSSTFWYSSEHENNSGDYCVRFDHDDPFQQNWRSYDCSNSYGVICQLVL